MMKVTTNAADVAGDLLKVGPVVHADVVRVTKNAGRRLLTAMRQFSSSGEGPDVETGEYRASWRMVERTAELGAVTVYVGTDSPQGYRLEYGFQGVDSQGRTVDQAPRPHVEPALASIAPKFVADVQKAVALGLGK